MVSVYAQSPDVDSPGCAFFSGVVFVFTVFVCREIQNRETLSFQRIPQTPLRASPPGHLVSLRPSPLLSGQHRQARYATKAARNRVDTARHSTARTLPSRIPTR